MEMGAYVNRHPLTYSPFADRPFVFGVPALATTHEEIKMNKHNKEQQEIRKGACSTGKSIAFIGMVKKKGNLQAFQQYINHLSAAGAREIDSAVEGNKIYYTAKTIGQRKTALCHLIQLNARKNNVIIPYWIGKQASYYRAHHNIANIGPTKKRTDKNSPSVKSKVIEMTNKPKRKYTKRNAPKRQIVKRKENIFMRIINKFFN